MGKTCPDEQAASPRGIFQHHAGAVQLSHSLHDGKTDAEAVAETAGFTVEAGEDRLTAISRNAGAVVHDVEHDPLRRIDRADANRATGGDMTDGVLQEVTDHGRQGGIVPTHP